MKHIAILTDEGWKIGEVIEVNDDNHVLMCCFKKIMMDGYKEFSLWVDTDRQIDVNKVNVLPIRPLTEIVPRLSSCTQRRKSRIHRIFVHNVISNWYLVSPTLECQVDRAVSYF